LEILACIFGLFLGTSESVKSAFEIFNLKKTIIKYYLEEYFGIDLQMNVRVLELLVLSLWLNSPMLSPIFYYTI
jgi:hypothetical protein